MLAVRCPILLSSDVETEWGDLEHVSPVDAGCEESRSGWVPIKADETELFPVGRNSRISAAWTNASPVIPVEVHTPKCFVVGHGIETMEYDPYPVGGESWIVLTNIRSRKLNRAAAIRIHDRNVTASTGRVVLKDDLTSIWRPSWGNGIAAEIRDLLQAVAVRTHCVNLNACGRLDLKCNQTTYGTTTFTGDTAAIVASRFDVSGLCGSQMRFGFTAATGLTSCPVYALQG